MTTDEFESIVGDFYGDHVELYEHYDVISRVTFKDGITAEIDYSDIDRTAREGIFFLCDMWAGLDADEGISFTWAKEAIRYAREVQIGKLLIDGIWNNGEDA